jgi:hypothetical protein
VSSSGATIFGNGQNDLKLRSNKEKVYWLKNARKKRIKKQRSSANKGKDSSITTSERMNG